MGVDEVPPVQFIACPEVNPSPECSTMGERDFDRHPNDAPLEEEAVRASSDGDDEGGELPAIQTLGTGDPIRLYLTQMARVSLLSREEELRLAERIAIAR